jgi:hypothetical protein
VTEAASGDEAGASGRLIPSVEQFTWVPPDADPQWMLDSPDASEQSIDESQPVDPITTHGSDPGLAPGSVVADPDAHQDPHALEASPAPETVVVNHLRGAFEAYEIGDPGRAVASVIPRPDHEYPSHHDTVLDGVTIEDSADEPRLELRAASVRGLSHRHTGKVRQDDYGFAVTADRRYLVAIVADGVSAGPHSHIAAGVAANRGAAELTRALASQTLQEISWKGLLESLANSLVGWVERSNDGGPAALSEVAAQMATTIIIAVVTVDPDASGNHEVQVVRLGDTSGWIVQPGRVWVSLGDVKNEGAMIAESATSGLPFVPDEPPEVITSLVAPGEVLVLMSDGIGDPLGAGRGEVGATLADAWATPPNPIHFAAQVDFGRKSFDDDRTAIAIWPVRG